MKERILGLSEVFVKGEFSMEKYLNGFEVYLDLNGMTSADKELWISVFAESYKTCEKLGKISASNNQ